MGYLRLVSSKFGDVPKEERGAEVSLNVRLLEWNNLTAESVQDPKLLGLRQTYQGKISNCSMVIFQEAPSRE